MQEEEARTKAEQAETKRQMFINVQPYVAQTLNIQPAGYNNPFSFGKSQLPHFTQGGHLDLLQFDISSHDDSDATSQNSVDLGAMIGSLERGPNTLFNKTNSMINTKGERYSNARGSVQKSEGEVGAADEDDISLGEIKVPNTTAPFPNSKMGQGSSTKNPFPMTLDKSGRRG
jgi:hypothetical protein